MNLTYPVMVTLNEIRSSNLYNKSWEKVLKANGGVNADMDKPFLLSSIIDNNGVYDCLRIVKFKPELNNLVRKFAVVCVDEVDHLLTDGRLKTTLDVAWKHANGEASDEELANAYGDAADAADAAIGTAAIDTARAVYDVYDAIDTVDRAEVESYQIEVLRKALDTGIVERKSK